MIYVAKPNAKEKDFIALLEKSRKLILAFLSGKKNISPTYFEAIVFEQMREAAKGTTFEGTVKQTGTHAFPDIIANKYFGVEVKMTANDHWTSTEISVTHSPRYRINMNLPSGKSIFDKIGVDYDTLRNDPNPIQKIKDYYRSQLKEGEELWWIDQDGDDKAVSPIIKPFRGLSAKEKENFVVEAMILFPEMFGNSSTKFERAAAYLIAEYNAVSANLRDLFTAGGQIKLKVKGKNVVVPQLAYRLHIRAKAIEKKIKELDAKTLIYYWRNDKLESDRLKQWKKLLNDKFVLVKSGVKASDIFDAGLL